jgi:hypothetical protein
VPSGGAVITVTVLLASSAEAAMVKNRIADRASPAAMRSARFTQAERASLSELANSGHAADRKQCVRYLRAGVSNPANHRFLVKLLHRLIPDRSSEIRWGGFQLLSALVEFSPEEIWPLTVSWGSVKNRSIRAGIACFVLEHLLEHHFSTFFPRVSDLIEDGNAEFAYTLACCLRLGQAERPDNAKAFDHLVERLQQSHPEVKSYFSSPRCCRRNKWLKEVRLVEELLNMPDDLQFILEELSQRMCYR